MVAFLQSRAERTANADVLESESDIDKGCNDWVDAVVARKAYANVNAYA